MAHEYIDDDYLAANPFAPGSQLFNSYMYGECPVATHDPEFQPLVAALWCVATYWDRSQFQWGAGRPYVFTVRLSRGDRKLTISLHKGGWCADAYAEFTNVLRRCLPQTQPQHGGFTLNLWPPSGKGIIFSCNL